MLLSIFLLTAMFVPGCHAGGTVADKRTGTAAIAMDGRLTGARDMLMRRASHTATRLGSGKVLITGGFVGEENSLAGTEFYDPQTGLFSAGENMHAARSSHTATLLLDGRVLIAGGLGSGYLDSAEIYDPRTGKFTLTPKMTTARSGHVAVLLKNGKVLLAGGVGTGWTFLSSAEIYDPASNTFTPTGAMTVPRESHTASLLGDGRVLVTGGHRGRRAAAEIFAGTEIYDPATGTFAASGNMTVKRHKHEAVVLAGGRVLILGGSDERDSQGAYRNAEIYDPAKRSFAAISNMNAARYKLQGTAVLLDSGKVLVAGGSTRAEVFDPRTSTFSFASGEMGEKRLFATATLLKSGEVLIVGGYDSRMAVSSRAWIFTS